MLKMSHCELKSVNRDKFDNTKCPYSRTALGAGTRYVEEVSHSQLRDNFIRHMAEDKTTNYKKGTK